MKSGKGNTKSKNSTNGGNKGKGKRRRVVNTQSQSSQSANNKNGKPLRTQDKGNGNHDNNNSNIEDDRINRDLANNENDGGKKAQLRDSTDEEGSTSHSSYDNTTRKGKELEEEGKDNRGTNQNRSQGHQLQEYDYLKGDGKDTWGINSPFETKQVYNFGLDLSDKSKSSYHESFKSPFYTSYDEGKGDPLSTMDFSKVLAEHDETLLYIFYTMINDEAQYRSAQELGRRGWLYDETNQTWSVTRKAGSKAKNPKDKGKGSTASGKDDEALRQGPQKDGTNGADLNRFMFNIEQWKIDGIKNDSISGTSLDKNRK